MCGGAKKVHDPCKPDTNSAHAVDQDVFQWSVRRIMIGKLPFCPYFGSSDCPSLR